MGLMPGRFAGISLGNRSAIAPRAFRGDRSTNKNNKMKLLIFDKDGTLIAPISPGVFVRNPQDQRLFPGVAEKIERYRVQGWGMAIASNQGGCDSIDPQTGKPFKTLDAAIEEMRFAMKLTGIEKAVFCPRMDGDCMYQVKANDVYHRGMSSYECAGFVGFRKPDPGMLLWLMAAWKYEHVLFVGDRSEDEGAAVGAAVEFQWAKDFFGDRRSSLEH
jgi:D-glycero-D-manno-heptose 1,7-bisphosphate phosphatase